MALDIDSLITRVESTHKKYIEEKERFKNETESLSNDKKTLEESLSKVRDDFNNLSISNEDLNRKYNVLESKYKTIEDTLAQKESIISDFDRKSKEQENIILGLNDSISSLKVDIESKDSEIKNLNLDKEELLKKAASQDSSIAKLNTENANLTREIVALKAQIKKLQEEKAITKDVKRTSLEDFIDSTIPVPEDSAAANLRPVKRVSEITENTIPYNFGRTSKEIMNKVLLLIDELFEGISLNNNNEYPLNNPQIVCDKVDMDKVTLSTVLNRLTSMTYNNKPLLVYKGNLYYATIDKDTIKNYISEN